MNREILIVDDDKKIAELIDFRLKQQGHATHVVHCGADAIDYVKKCRPILVMLDIRMPDMSGVDVLKEIQKNNSETHAIMISAHADVKVAVDCMKMGAYDFIEKPIAFPELDTKIKHIFNQFRLTEEVSMLKKELGEKYKYKSIVGNSQAIKKVLHSVDLAAKSDANILVQGESGTGKELVARAIHFNGPRKEGPFVAFNCGAIPENLLESELFGHEKGSFTGAISQKIGKFEQAQGGTIFLDEIADLTASLQVKLLRVLQEREIERVGGSKSIPIEVRFITATNKDLKKLVGEGKFREDLYFRVNVFPISIPPLRERREDIPELLQYFIKKRSDGRKQRCRIDNDALKKLVEYQWPGNIRELENFVERVLLVKGDSEVIEGADIDSLEFTNNGTMPLQAPALSDRNRVISDAEKVFFEKAIKESGGNISKASKMLQISRDTFYRKMKKYSLTK